MRLYRGNLDQADTPSRPGLAEPSPVLQQPAHETPTRSKERVNPPLNLADDLELLEAQRGEQN